MAATKNTMIKHNRTPHIINMCAATILLILLIITENGIFLLSIILSIFGIWRIKKDKQEKKNEKKNKNTLSGGVPMTPKLRYLQKNNYMEFIKQYQEIMLQIRAEGI